jgi:DNA repair protein RadC
MKRISMKMSKREMFTVIQSLKPVQEKHKISHLAQAINRAVEEIPNNEVEYLVFQILNSKQVHIETLMYCNANNTRSSIDMTFVMREILSVPGADAIVVVHNHPAQYDLKPSESDLRWALHIATLFEFVGFNFLDFAIVNHTSFYSFHSNHKEIFEEARNRVKKLLDLE